MVAWSTRKRIQCLRMLLVIETLYPKRNLSVVNQRHKIYPYLLRGLEIGRPHQVWSTDITYIPMSKGFVYLVAVMDWYSRCALSRRVSTTMDADFCVDALEEAIENYGCPETFTSVLKGNGIKSSMDGKYRWVDNVFVERLWRSVKYEAVYLKAYDTVAQARQSLRRYFVFCNERQRHQSLNK